MNFDGMTAEQAAQKVAANWCFGCDNLEHVTLACEHFYDEGFAAGFDAAKKQFEDPVHVKATEIIKECAAKALVKAERSYREGYDAAEAVYMRATSECNIPNLQQDVRRFMEAFGQAMSSTPQWPGQSTMDLRVRLVAEEFCEWLRDSGYEYSVWIATNENGEEIFDSVDYEPTLRSLPKSADALIDLLYVAIGSLLAMGIDMWPLWAEVQRANMAKLGGPVVNGKQMKPEGWQPPAIDELLCKQGWEGEDA